MVDQRCSLSLFSGVSRQFWVKLFASIWPVAECPTRKSSVQMKNLADLLVTENKVVQMGRVMLSGVSGRTNRMLYVCMHMRSARRLYTSTHGSYYKTLIF